MPGKKLNNCKMYNGLTKHSKAALFIFELDGLLYPFQDDEASRRYCMSNREFLKRWGDISANLHGLPAADVRPIMEGFVVVWEGRV